VGEAEDKKDADVLGTFFGKFFAVVFTRFFRLLFQLWDTKPGRALLAFIVFSVYGAVVTGWNNVSHGAHTGKGLDSLKLKVETYHHEDSTQYAKWHRSDSLQLADIETILRGRKPPMRVAAKPRPAAVRDTSNDHRTAQNSGAQRTF
jgi:hypothetical protein